MKKAFTLVELLIVVVVIVTLMAITFRLAGVGDDQQKHNLTIARLQRLENALSGYYAAYGTYPPVALHGSQNIYAKADEYGIQSEDETETQIWGWNNIGDDAEEDAWRQVRAACQAQPVDCRFPFPDDQEWQELISAVSDGMQQLANEDSDSRWEGKEDLRQQFAQGFDGLNSGTLGRFNGYQNEVSWQEVQIFKFGLLSYLLPRYLIMMQGNETFYEHYAQWTGNNDVPCDPFTGERMSWTQGSESIKELSESAQSVDLAKVANIPSQAVCARWMPNFEGSLSCSRELTLFGIDVKAKENSSEGIGLNLSSLAGNINTLTLYTPGPYGQKNGKPYVLDGVTIRDGWNQDFYYYSPAPYQGYTLWSAGPNGRTFPPWLRRDLLDSDARRCTAIWIEDDIMHLSH